MRGPRRGLKRSRSPYLSADWTPWLQSPGRPDILAGRIRASRYPHLHMARFGREASPDAVWTDPDLGSAQPLSAPCR